MTKALYFFIALAVITGILRIFINDGETISLEKPTPVGDPVMCTMDARECPDGSYVGRTGPNCEFVCPDVPATTAVPSEVQSTIDAKFDLIQLTTPLPGEVIATPLVITGQVRGTWYFEGSFPVTLTNWDGLIIAEGFATAEGEWMTEEFVPFTATIEYESPFLADSPDFMERGSLILQKDNPSGLPEHDDALEIPVRFTRG